MKNYLILFSLFLCFAFSLDAKANEDHQTPKLSLTGHATLYKPPDQLILTIGVVNISINAQDALEQNSFKMQSVIEALEKLGLTRSEYQTGLFTITPTYTPYPKNPLPEWKPTINGYEIKNSLVIKTDKLGLAGQIIDDANRAGANSIQDIHFDLKDSRKYWDEAITQATQNAFADARVIANAAGVSLERLLSISLNNPPENVLRPMSARVFALETSTPIEPGDVEINAKVTVEFEIHPLD